MTSTAVTIAVEGAADVPVARRILLVVGLVPGPVHEKAGKTGLDARIRSYNHAARFAPWLVLRDLNRDEPCAGALVTRLLPEPATHMRLRIAVRETEAWLLADREQIAEYLSISVSRIPTEPERVIDPKQTLVNRRSPRRTIREDIVPEQGVSSQVGPGYLARLSEYATYHWRPEVAAQLSPSLARCLAALGRFRR